MINEEIITALKNAIDRGETIEFASQILISSGYNEKEVMEASQFVPNNFSSREINRVTTQLNPEILKQEEYQQTDYQKQNPQPNNQTNPQFNPQLNNEIKRSYKKEVILVVILIILIGFLAITFFFKNQILEFISKNLLNRFS